MSAMLFCISASYTVNVDHLVAFLKNMVKKVGCCASKDRSMMLPRSEPNHTAGSPLRL